MQDNAVSLYRLQHPGLIVAWSTGVWYQNQVGGHACDQETLEGFFLPLPDICLGRKPPPSLFASAAHVDGEGRHWIDLYKALDEIIRGKYGGECSAGIDSDTADKIDSLLRTDPNEFETGLSVDRAKLEQCQEAWIFVTGKNVNSIDGFGEFKGVLTWPNSD